MKFTAATRTTILDALASGLPLHVAASYAEVTRQILHKWLRAGRDALDDPKAGADTADLRQFAIDVDRTLAKYQKTQLERIAAGTPAWQGNAWILERRFPDDYRRRSDFMSVTPPGDTNAQEPDYDTVAHLARDPELARDAAAISLRLLASKDDKTPKKSLRNKKAAG